MGLILFTQRDLQTYRKLKLTFTVCVRHASDVITATVKIVDENLDNVEGYKEFITHEVPSGD